MLSSKVEMQGREKTTVYGYVRIAVSCTCSSERALRSPVSLKIISCRVPRWKSCPTAPARSIAKLDDDDARGFRVLMHAVPMPTHSMQACRQHGRQSCGTKRRCSITIPANASVFDIFRQCAYRHVMYCVDKRAYEENTIIGSGED